MEDGTDAQEETPEDSPQLGDQIKLHHFTELRVVTGSMGLELERKEKIRKCQIAEVTCVCALTPANDVTSVSENI